jgi:tetratricopeptide (TPR) repeat protein
METSPRIKAMWDLAILLHEQGQYGGALDCLRALEGLLPDNPALLANLGVAFRDCGELVPAERYLRRACTIQPDDPAAHFNLALTLLRAGRLREGFHEYEWRWQLRQFAEQRRQFPQPLWNGEPLNGRRILIYSEQGAGDAIQFVRYAPLVRAAGGDPIVEALPHLERLFSWIDGGYPIVTALTRGVEFDVQCPLMGLPRRFATELESIPTPASFSIPGTVRAEWARRLRTGRMAVGVVWAGNPKHSGDKARSIPAYYLLPLARLPGVQYWSLQTGPSAADTPTGIANLAEELIDFGETAAVISGLDLVITVDTAVAHLAGSLGKPVWLLAAYASDWRWMLGREDTPWYPSMRIFRQKRPGEWRGVMDRVASELEVWIPERIGRS